MRFVYAALRTIVGLCFGMIAMIALLPAFGAFVQPNSGPLFVASMWAVALLGGALSFMAPTMRRAFGRGFLMAGTCFLALPLSAILLSYRAYTDPVVLPGITPDEFPSDTGYAAAEAIGAGLAAMAMTGVAAIIGLSLGAILIVAGLVLCLGGQRNVAGPTAVAARREPTF